MYPPDSRKGKSRGKLRYLCEASPLAFVAENAGGAATDRDFIIKCRARLSVDGSRLLMLELPQPGFDPDLKAILDEQKKPVSTWVEGLGTFTLNRTVDWFEATVDWLGSEIALDFDRGVPEEMASAQETGRALMASQALELQ